MALQFAAIGCAGGLLAGVMFYIFEVWMEPCSQGAFNAVTALASVMQSCLLARQALGYGLCCMLERHGLMCRFCPNAKRLTDHSMNNIVSVGAFYCPVYWLVARDWRGLAATATLNFSFLRRALQPQAAAHNHQSIASACSQSQRQHCIPAQNPRVSYRRIFAFVWMGLVLHDAWFFFMHR